MALRLDHLQLDAAGPEVRGASGSPLRLSLDAIDEDPAQPRREFDAEALKGLAATIADRGVRQPISVRPHPESPGRWMLNFGARRLRASKLAGQTDIPAFVDATTDSYDQVIENEQRQGLTPMELALFVQRRLARGETQTEVSRHLGKSGAYVSYVCALIDPPDWLMQLYRDGRCRGVKELYDLRRLHEKAATSVEVWLEGRAFVARGDVETLRVSLEQIQRMGDANTSGVANDAASTNAPAIRPSTPSKVASFSDAPRPAPLGAPKPNPLSRGGVALCADWRGRIVEVILDRWPQAESCVLVREGKSELVSAAINELSGLRLVLK